MLDVACGNSFPSNVLKLGFAVSVYCIWSNRNMHKFKGITRKYEDVMRDIKVLALFGSSSCLVRARFLWWLLHFWFFLSVLELVFVAVYRSSAAAGLRN
ncbi:hypothetical protein U1Q18_045081 [Sarracenia purpurea var. burkii]